MNACDKFQRAASPFGSRHRNAVAIMSNHIARTTEPRMLPLSDVNRDKSAPSLCAISSDTGSSNARNNFERDAFARAASGISSVSATPLSAEAQRRSYQQLRVSASLKTMLPWQIAMVEETIATMGEEWWPYGIERNRHVIETFTRYHHEQGLSPRKLTVEEMFAPETFAEFRI